MTPGSMLGHQIAELCAVISFGVARADPVLNFGDGGSRHLHPYEGLATLAWKRNPTFEISQFLSIFLGQP